MSGSSLEEVWLEEAESRLIAPSWFLDRMPRGRTVPFRVLLVESAGESGIALLAAALVARADAGMDEMVMFEVADDQRRADTARQVAAGAVQARYAAVVGHNGSGTALPAADVYRHGGMPYFTPGCSSDALCVNESEPVFQVFPRDSGQAQCFAGHLTDVGGRVIISHDNTRSGQALGALTRQELDRRGREYEYAGSHWLDAGWSPAPCGHRSSIAFFGARESAKSLVQKAGHCANLTYLLSDDSFQLAVAPCSDPPAGGVKTCFPHFDSQSPIEVARIIDRVKSFSACAGGPYILTSYLAVYMTLACLRDGAATPLEFLEFLSSRPWQSPFGQLRFDRLGRANGMEWTMHSCGASRFDSPQRSH